MKRTWIHSIGSMISVVLFASNTFGQNAIPPEMRGPVMMNLSGQGYGVVIGSAAPAGKLLGDVYLDTAWNVGNILLQSGAMMKGYRVRYDLKAETLEFQTSMAVRLLDCEMIKSVVWVDKAATRYFVNAAGYTLDHAKLPGMLEVLADGSKPLFRRTTLYVQPSNYVVSLDVGSRDSKILKQSALFYAEDDNLHTVKSRKDVLHALSDKGELVEAFAKENDLNLRKDDDVVRVFEYYNSLTAEKAEP